MVDEMLSRLIDTMKSSAKVMNPDGKVLQSPLYDYLPNVPAIAIDTELH